MNDTIIQYNKNMLQFQINVTAWCVMPGQTPAAKSILMHFSSNLSCLS